MFIDYETTGLFGQKKWDVDYEDFPRIVAASWNISRDEHTHFYQKQPYYVLKQDEGFHIPEDATLIHGITDERCAASNFDHAQVLTWMIEAAEKCKVIVGYNVYYDTSILKGNVLRIFGKGSDMSKRAIAAVDKAKRIDVLRALAAMNHGYVSLEETHYRLFKESFPAHHAGEDVKALQRVFFHALKNDLLKWRMSSLLA